MKRNVIIGLSLPKCILLKIDNKRNDISRSRFILRILESKFSSTGNYVHNEIEEIEDSSDAVSNPNKKIDKERTF